MKIIHHLTVELTRREEELPLDAVQGDGNTRAVKISLLENGAPWEVPEGVTAAVAFRKADGHKGLYDTLPDGSQAVTVDGSAVTAVLAPQVLSCAGTVSAAVVFYDESLRQLATFPFTIRVEANPAAGQEASNDYYRYSSMEAVSQAVEDALASLEHEKQDFLTQAREALQTVHETATENAPAIVCEAVGQTITVSDAASRPLQGLTLYGKTLQNGTPTPETPVPLESLGNSGTVTVSVTGSSDEPAQTVTAATLNGLPGIPVTGGGNYTDESGQEWICDEVDFARGVYVRRIAEICLDGSVPPNQYVQTGDAMRFGWTGKSGFTPKDYTNAELAMCNRFTPSVSPIWNNYLDGGICAHTGGNIYLRYDAVTSPEAMAEYLADNPVVYLYVMETPIETPLSAASMAAFAALRSHKSHTTAFNNAGAGMKLRYTADTKRYIDQKLAALSAAMLA